MIRQFIRYVSVGITNTLIDFGIYIVLTRGFEFWREHYLVANAIAFCVVVTWSFFWNKHWSFRNREKKHSLQYAQFVIATLGGIGIVEGGLYFGVEVYSLSDIVTKVAVGPLVVLWNFFAYRWIFSPRVSDDAARVL